MSITLFLVLLHYISIKSKHCFIGGCGQPIAMTVYLIGISYVGFKHKDPNSDSTTDDMTDLMRVQDHLILWYEWYKYSPVFLLTLGLTRYSTTLSIWIIFYWLFIVEYAPYVSLKNLLGSFFNFWWRLLVLIVISKWNSGILKQYLWLLGYSRENVL